MRKILSAILEELMLILFLLWIGKNAPERIPSPNTLWIMGIIIGIAIAIAKSIEVFTDYRFCREGISHIKRIEVWTIRFTLITLMFYAAFSALEYFGNMPATNILLILLSFGYTFCHLVISHVLDVLTGLNKKSMKDMFHDVYLEEFDDESEEL